MSLNWIAVALSRDVPPAVVMPVVVAGQDLALWRSAGGRIAAWADRCPHRGMRLSHGYVRGEALSCIYHGWSYGTTGACLRIPAHPSLQPPETIRVPVHAVQEAGGVVWVAEAAPDALPPDLGGLVPLRSLTVEAGAGALAALAELATGTDGVARGQLAGVEVALLMQPLPEGRTVVHALVAAAGSVALVAVSRALEALRRRAEAVEGAA